MMHLRQSAWILVAVCGLWGTFAAVGCNDQGNPTRTLSGAADGADAGVDEGDAGAEPPRKTVDPCKTAVDGTKCGGLNHCVQHHCVVNVCGDKIVAGSEECDDGNQVLGDGCDPSCRKEKAACGDGRVQLGEECDDGNKVNDDACSNLCTKNSCGNGRIDLREECDDGNQVDSDRCSNGCTLNACGNGRVDPGEQCDDGNKNDNDGCTNQCTIARCGNGIKEGKEECDDGNAVDTDTCSNACTANLCGNGRLDPGESCDGNIVGVLCENQCKLATPVCRNCEDLHCEDYLKESLDTPLQLVTECYKNPDPSYIQACTDVIACARRTNCAYTTRGAEQCYCGTAASGPCQLGMGVDGPCRAEFEHAAGSSDPVVVTARFGERPKYPIGTAVFMLQCDRDLCPDVCVPKP